MSYPFKEITLMWRPSQGTTRIKVGSVDVKENGSILFHYDERGVQQAKEKDPKFSGYPGLPLARKDFTDSDFLKSIFFNRLISLERSDRHELLGFWLISEEDAKDKLLLLAFTQALSFTDMFEFVPIYKSNSNITFITDIAALSKYDFDLSVLKKGDKIDYKAEKDNPVDKRAIRVYHGGIQIGYIKQGHNLVFRDKRRIKLSVWSVVNAPNYKALYVKVDFGKN